jgi:hypothetical protein
MTQFDDMNFVGAPATIFTWLSILELIKINPMADLLIKCLSLIWLCMQIYGWVEKRKNCWKNMSKDLKKKALSGIEKYRGKKHTNETKQKLSKSMQNRGLAEANSQYGTIWITNGLPAILPTP